MRSNEDSTPFPTPQDTLAAQRLIALAALDLASLDRRLFALAESIERVPDEILPTELRHGLQAVRSDVLADGIATLNQLAKLTEVEASNRRRELERLATDFTEAN